MNLALQTDPGNTEALQSLASVRLSQQRPDDAKACLEQAWTQWKDLEPGMFIYRSADNVSLFWDGVQTMHVCLLYPPAFRS